MLYHDIQRTNFLILCTDTEMVTVYYNWIPGKTIAFPPGFRMITPGESVFDEGITEGNAEMELSIMFPSCWDGILLDSPDQSHVAFPLVCLKMFVFHLLLCS